MQVPGIVFSILVVQALLVSVAVGQPDDFITTNKEESQLAVPLNNVKQNEVRMNRKLVMK